MNSKKAGLLLSMLLTMVCATTAFTAPWRGWRGSGGWGPQGVSSDIYNPATVESLSGEVLAVERVIPPNGLGAGIHLKLKTEKEIVSVHLGPAWYIERFMAPVEKGDTIEVKGSRVTITGKPAIIAADVKKGDALLNFRDDRGMPAWNGWRRGPTGSVLDDTSAPSGEP